MSLLVRSGLVWLLLLVTAIANGAVRQGWLIPAWGEAVGHVLSTLVLSLLILGVGWLLSGWLDIASNAEEWLVGAVWLVLTLTFEFIGGRFLFGIPWEKLLADYNLAQGRVWLLVPLITLLTPRLTRYVDRVLR